LSSDISLTVHAEFLGLPIPIPSLTEQHATVQSVEVAFGRIDQLLAEASKAALLDRLDEAILAKAFRGELVAQDDPRGSSVTTMAAE
jgi:type I restriction enzyme S subunit